MFQGRHRVQRHRGLPVDALWGHHIHGGMSHGMQEGGYHFNLLSDNDIHHAADGHYIGVSMALKT